MKGKIQLVYKNKERNEKKNLSRAQTTIASFGTTVLPIGFVVVVGGARQ
jgi:hypothetical protein